MIRVERPEGTVPEVLGVDSKRRIAEFERAKVGACKQPSGKKNNSPFRLYRESSIKDSLNSLFNGKCAYCEGTIASSQPTDVEHFRPKGKVNEDETHPGYWWLGMEWDNLLPSCIDCNRRRWQPTPVPGARRSQVGMREYMQTSHFSPLKTGKDAAFPLVENTVRAVYSDDPAVRNDALAKEVPLLIDPTVEDPLDYLEFAVDLDDSICLVFPKRCGPEAVAQILPALTQDAHIHEQKAREAGVSAKGAVTIQILGLNRIGLLQARTALFQDMKFLLLLCVDLAEIKAAINGRLQSIEQFGSNSHQEDLILYRNSLFALEKAMMHLIEELEKKASPEAPFSAAARAWLAANVNIENFV